MCLIPAPRGTGIVSAPMPKKLLIMTGIGDCYTSARSCLVTLGNSVKVTFDAIFKTCSYLTLGLWKQTVFTKSQEFTGHLRKARVSVQRAQVLLQLWPPHKCVCVFYKNICIKVNIACFLKKGKKECLQQRLTINIK